MFVSVVIQFGPVNRSDCYLIFYLSAIFSVCLVVVLVAMRQQHLKQLEPLQGKIYFERKVAEPKLLHAGSNISFFSCMQTDFLYSKIIFMQYTWNLYLRHVWN
jgi:hypothetical protein